MKLRLSKNILHGGAPMPSSKVAGKMRRYALKAEPAMGLSKLLHVPSIDLKYLLSCRASQRFFTPEAQMIAEIGCTLRHILIRHATVLLIRVCNVRQRKRATKARVYMHNQLRTLFLVCSTFESRHQILINHCLGIVA